MSVIVTPPPTVNGLVTPSWRDTIQVHPAAALFPSMNDVDPAGLDALAADIGKHGLMELIKLWEADKNTTAVLLDGRNRLDALERALGRPVRIVRHAFRNREWWVLEADDEDGESTPVSDRFEMYSGSGIVVLDGGIDPWAYVVSANIHRRHLTAEDKRKLTAKLIKAKPKASNNAISKLAKVDDKTVAKVRREMEGRSEFPNVETRTDTKGRRQPAHKPRSKEKTGAGKTAPPSDAGTPTVDPARPPYAEGEARIRGCFEDAVRDVCEASACAIDVELPPLSDTDRDDAITNLRADAADVGRLIERLGGKTKHEAMSAAAAASNAREAAAKARADVGPDSGGEVARKLARLGELENKVRRLEIMNGALQSENEDLKASAAANGHAAAPPTLATAWEVSTGGEQKAVLASLDASKLCALLDGTTKEDLKKRIIEHLTLEGLLAALERKLPGAPPSPKVRAAFKNLEKTLLP
jgi:hypothetical protein